MLKITTIALLGLMVSSCTSVDVRPLPAAEKLAQVCIYDDPKVIVPDFLQVVIDGFDRHGIATKIVHRQQDPGCEHMVTYTALRSWDFDDYLSHAELRISRSGSQVAYARYHLKGKGGLSLAKWASVKSKMDPVIDELLAAYKLPE